MNVDLLAVVALLVGAAAAMFWPLRTSTREGAQDIGPSALEIERDAKLEEIRELDLDFRLGKLSVDDYRALGAVLRTDAVEIMRQIDACAADGRPPRASGSKR